jgi:enoyl-CoA hydratase/carnithine racemase
MTDDLARLDRPAPAVAVLTLNRPAKYNALSGALLTEADQRLAELAEQASRGELRALVLTGADPAFCAGLDLTELGRPGAFPPGALRLLFDFPVPVIGAINGVAVTGGLEVALACDFRIGSERARFADTHARVGVTPAWGLTARLPQAVGQSWARQMSFTGDFVDAATALRIGLLNEVVPHDDLLDRAIQLAGAVASTDAATAGRIRELYGIGRDQSGGAALAREQELAAGGVRVADPNEFGARRAAVFARGRAQQ